MSDVVLTLRRIGSDNKQTDWALFAPKGHQISPSFKFCTQEEALEKASAWASSWTWTIEVEDEKKRKKD